MAYKRPIPCKNPPATHNRKRPQVFPRLNIRLRPSRFPGVTLQSCYKLWIFACDVLELLKKLHIIELLHLFGIFAICISYNLSPSNDDSLHHRSMFYSNTGHSVFKSLRMSIPTCCCLLLPYRSWSLIMAGHRMWRVPLRQVVMKVGVFLVVV
jgi:hypothetical protein